MGSSIIVNWYFMTGIRDIVEANFAVPHHKCEKFVFKAVDRFMSVASFESRV